MVHNQHLDAVSTSADVSKTQSGQAALYCMLTMGASFNTSNSDGSVGIRQWQNPYRDSWRMMARLKIQLRMLGIDFAGSP